jgi:glucose/arabinose dehydrogenase/sugar lactone lactonase YvrE
MQRLVWVLSFWFSVAQAAWGADRPPKPLLTGLKNPAGVIVGTDGRIYVSVMGEIDKDGDGAILVLKDGKAIRFTAGLDDPQGLAAFGGWLFVADKKRIWRIDRKGKAEVFVPAGSFPIPPVALTGLVADPESGALYVSDPGDLNVKRAVIYRIEPNGKVRLVADEKRSPALKAPNGLVLDGAAHLLAVDFQLGELFRIKVADGTATKVVNGFGRGSGLAWDRHGRLYISATRGGRVFGIPAPGANPVLLAEGFKSPVGLCLDPAGKRILITDLDAGTLTALPVRIPGHEVDETPLPLETAAAFPHLKWTGWKPVSDKGKPAPLRPLVLTHAGDGSNRIFVATQRGVIHVFPNDQQAAKTKVFLDLQDRVTYDDNQNEEGFLGLAFPRYKKNGEFFVFYTEKKAKLSNVLSRFRVDPKDPDRADPTSEEVLLRISKPFWNHDGGTLCFGPDGFLYVALGDGGAANDPYNNAQNLKTILGKILRIDIDRKGKGTPYAIPADNPFVKRTGVRPEIWAYGLRNVWRMAFDRQTGKLWAADVGQNLYEEIDLIVRGGNYGWNVREGLHPFGANGSGPRPDLIDPIWEYHHDIGKSIIGGHVYRGRRLPELRGSYLYADYVTGRLWALRYDEAKKRVVANRPIKDRGQPVFSFGEDENGEAYYLIASNTGQGIYHFVPSGKGKGGR